MTQPTDNQRAEVARYVAEATTDLDEVTDVPTLTRMHERVATIADTVGEALTAVRDRLTEVAIADAGGAGLTRRVDGVQVVVTDPKARPRVVDLDAFASWYRERWPDEVRDVETPRVDVDDPEAARETLGWLAAHLRAHRSAGEVLVPSTVLTKLLGSIAYGVETWPALPEDALELATKRANLRTVEGADRWRLIDADGVEVDGVEVAPPARQAVQVRPDKAARAHAVAELRASLARRAAELDA